MISQCFQHHPAHTAEGQAGVDTLPCCLGPGLPHKPTTVCEEYGLPVQHGGLQHRGPTGNHPGSLLFHPLHYRLHIQLLTLLPPEVLWSHQGQGRHRVQGTKPGLCELVPVEPPPDQYRED